MGNIAYIDEILTRYLEGNGVSSSDILEIVDTFNIVYTKALKCYNDYNYKINKLHYIHQYGNFYAKFSDDDNEFVEVDSESCDYYFDFDYFVFTIDDARDDKRLIADDQTYFFEDLGITIRWGYRGADKFTYKVWFPGRLFKLEDCKFNDILASVEEKYEKKDIKEDWGIRKRVKF